MNYVGAMAKVVNVCHEGVYVWAVGTEVRTVGLKWVWAVIKFEGAEYIWSRGETMFGEIKWDRFRIEVWETLYVGSVEVDGASQVVSLRQCALQGDSACGAKLLRLCFSPCGLVCLFEMVCTEYVGEVWGIFDRDIDDSAVVCA